MKGKCYYCNVEVSEKNVKRHVKGCKVRKAKIEESIANCKNTKSQYILSIVPQYESKDYCLYIAIDTDITLENLDSFLRNIWVECCGHLSSFTIDGINYDSSCDYESIFSDDNETMDFKLKQVLAVGDKFRYDYDFGSTTTLKLEVIDEYLTGENHSEIEILARNEEIEHLCEQCNQKAKYYNYEREGFFCEDCIDEEEMIYELEYTNSPRDGVCGYVGNKDNEKPYLPGNDLKFRKSRAKKQKDMFEDIDTYEKDFEFLLDSVMENINLELEDRTNKLFNKVKRNKFTQDLRQLLECNTKSDLCKMAAMLNIVKISKLNKGQLIEKLLEVYEEKITEALYLIDSERYEFLEKVFTNNGVLCFEADNVTSNIEYYIEYGILFPVLKNCEVYLVMPNEVMNVVKSLKNDEYKKILDRNTELVKLFWGMTYSYGVLVIDDFIKMLKNYIDYSLDEIDIYGIVVSGANYYGQYIMQGNIGRNMMIELEDVVEVINTRECFSSDRDFCIIEKKELLEAATDEYLIKNPISMKLKKYFKNNWKLEDKYIDMLVINLYFNIQENESEELIESIVDSFGNIGDDELTNLLGELNNFINNTRLWRLKGYTLKELNSNNNKNTSAVKIGRNASCVCGSGKKYKKCCGSKVIELF